MRLIKLTLLVGFFFMVATNSSAGETDAEKPKDDEVKLTKKEAILKNKAYFVRVEIQLLEDKKKKESSLQPRWQRGGSEYNEYILNKRTMVLPGLVFKNDLVFIKSLHLVPAQYGSIQIINAENKTFSGEYFGQLIQFNGQLLKVKDGSLAAPTLQACPTGEDAKMTYHLFLENREDKLYFHMKPVPLMAHPKPFLSDENFIPPAPARYGRSSSSVSVSLMLTQKGQPIGYLGGVAYIENGVPSWITKKTIDSEILNKDQILGAKEIAVQKVNKTIYKAIIHFRAEKGGSSYSRYSYRGEGRVTAKTIELKTSACLLDAQGQLLIPTEIPIKHTRRITKVEIFAGEKNMAAEYKGLFRDLGGVIVFCKDLVGIKPHIHQTFIPARGELFYALAFDRDSGMNSAELNWVRFNNMSKGYKDTFFRIVIPSPSLYDTFYLNRAFQIIGFSAILKKDKADQLKSKRGYYSSRGSQKFYTFAKIKDHLAKPADFYDPEAIPLEKKKANIPLWLGVDLQSGNKNIIEHLKAVDITKHGKRGFIVSHVYKSSPAEKLGLQPLDILISVTSNDSKTEVFMEGNSYGGRFGGGHYWGRGGGENYRLYFSRFFSNRKNELTTMLTDLGEGRKVTLKYFSKGKTKTAQLVLEKAPPDFDTAEKSIDEDLGLTVKDVTYEVKEGMRLKADDAGVIVSKTDSGKAAQIAGLGIFEILVSVDGVKIKNANHFKELISQSRKAKKKDITIKVNRLDKSRIVKLNLERREKTEKGK